MTPKAKCGCGNAKGQHEIVCRDCWREVPHSVKAELTASPDRRITDMVRNQILRFAAMRKAPEL